MDENGLGALKLFKSYVNILKKRKKFVLVSTVILFLLVFLVIFLLNFKFNSETTSLIALFGGKGNESLAIEQKLILESPDVLMPVIQSNFGDAMSLYSFKKNQFEASLVKEKVDRTNEQLVSFLLFTVKDKSYAVSKKVSEDISKSFITKVNSEYEESKKIAQERLKAFENEETLLKSDIQKIETAMLDSSSNDVASQEQIKKFINQITPYTGNLSDLQKDKGIDSYNLIDTKLINDIKRFKTSVLDAGEETWTSKYREKEAASLVTALKDYSAWLSANDINKVSVEELVARQTKLSAAIAQFENSESIDTKSEEYDGKESLAKILSLRKKITESNIEKLKFQEDIFNLNLKYRIVSSPSFPSNIDSSSYSIISVSNDEADVYSVLEAKNIITGSEVLNPILETYLNDKIKIGFDEFTSRNLKVERVEYQKTTRDIKIMPFLSISVKLDDPALAQKINEKIIAVFFDYMKKYLNQDEQARLIKEKIASKTEDIKQLSTDVSIFESNVYDNNMSKMKNMNALSLKLILSDFKNRLSEVELSKIKLQEDLNKIGEVKVVSAPADFEENYENFSPVQNNSLTISVAVIFALFVSMLLAIFYDTKIPEYKREYKEFVKVSPVCVSSTVLSGAKKTESNETIIQAAQEKSPKNVAVSSSSPSQTSTLRVLKGKTITEQMKNYLQEEYAELKQADVLQMSQQGVKKEDGVKEEHLIDRIRNKLKNTEFQLKR